MTQIPSLKDMSKTLNDTPTLAIGDLIMSCLQELYNRGVLNQREINPIITIIGTQIAKEMSLEQNIEHAKKVLEGALEIASDLELELDPDDPHLNAR